MQILSTRQTTTKGPDSLRFSKPQKEENGERGGILDTFRPKYEKLDIHLDQPEYQDIKDLEAANMLGHFAQTMQNKGYPFRLLSAEQDKSGVYKKGEKISDKDALYRLRKGEAVLLQPMRDLQLDFSTNSMTAVAAVGAAGAVGTTGAAGLSRMAKLSKDTKMSGGKQGFSIKFGEPVVIENYSQLKLLHQMYDPTEKIESKSETGKAAHHLSYFTQRTVGSAYPWRFYVKDDSNAILRVAKHTAKGTVTGGAIGVIAGGAIGGLIGLISGRNLESAKMGAKLGAGVCGAVGGVTGAWESSRTSIKGTPINAVEALENVLNDKKVVFQESRARSLPSLPFLGELTWFSDNGVGSGVSNPEELELMYYMQSQEPLPKPAKKKEPAKKPDPNVLIVDRSVHYHMQDNGLTVNDNGTKVVLPPNASARF
jgi:hypothetical protein